MHVESTLVHFLQSTAKASVTHVSTTRILLCTLSFSASSIIPVCRHYISYRFVFGFPFWISISNFPIFYNLFQKSSAISITSILLLVARMRWGDEEIWREHLRLFGRRGCFCRVFFSTCSFFFLQKPWRPSSCFPQFAWQRKRNGTLSLSIILWYLAIASIRYRILLHTLPCS